MFFFTESSVCARVQLPRLFQDAHEAENVNIIIQKVKISKFTGLFTNDETVKSTRNVTIKLRLLLEFSFLVVFFLKERSKYTVMNYEYKETDSINPVVVTEVSFFVGNPV